MLDDSSFVFRSYRIGEELFDQKFAFEIVSDFSAQEIYNRADLARKSYYVNMYAITKTSGQNILKIMRCLPIPCLRSNK